MFLICPTDVFINFPLKSRNLFTASSNFGSNSGLKIGDRLLDALTYPIYCVAHHRIYYIAIATGVFHIGHAVVSRLIWCRGLAVLLMLSLCLYRRSVRKFSLWLRYIDNPVLRVENITCTNAYGLTV